MLDLDGTQLPDDDKEVLTNDKGHVIGGIYKPAHIVQIVPGYFQIFESFSLRPTEFSRLERLYTEIGDFDIRIVEDGRVIYRLLWSELIELGDWLSKINKKAVKKWGDQFLIAKRRWIGV